MLRFTSATWWKGLGHVGRCECQQPLTDEGPADRLTQQLPAPTAVATFRDQLLLTRSNRPGKPCSLAVGTRLTRLPNLCGRRTEVSPEAGQLVGLDTGGFHVLARPLSREAPSRCFMVGSNLHRSDARFARAVVARPRRRRIELPHSLTTQVGLKDGRVEGRAVIGLDDKRPSMGSKKCLESSEGRFGACALGIAGYPLVGGVAPE
jgi:hypothetical protein